LSFIHELADKGVDQALAQNTHLANGLNIQNGKATHPAIKEVMGLDL
jgi:alanine dehydrogenase